MSRGQPEWRKLLEAVARLGGRQREEEVVRLLGEASQSAREAGCANCAADLDIEAAEALARIGREDEARRSPALRGAPRAGEHRVLRRRWVEALLTVGRALARIDHAGAEEAFREVVAGAEVISSRTHPALGRRELRRLGVRMWKRGAAGGPGEPLGPLSSRELEIARLAAAGLSNPEIARTVFLSRKVVLTGASPRSGEASLRDGAQQQHRMKVTVYIGAWGSGRPPGRRPSRERERERETTAFSLA